MEYSIYTQTKPVEYNQNPHQELDPEKPSTQAQK